MGKRKLRPPPDPRWLNTDGTRYGARTYGLDGRLKLHAKKYLDSWHQTRAYRVMQRAPPLGTNDDRRNHIKAAKIQNLARIKLLLPYRLRQISKRNLASKIMARKTTRVLGDVVTSYL